MAEVNADLARYVFASVMKHLKDVATADSNHPFLIEGVDEKDDRIQQAKFWVEARLTGPFVQQQQGQQRVWVQTNVLIHHTVPDYDIVRICGLYQAAYSRSIPVWNYGDLAGDYVAGDPSTHRLLGCLRTKPGKVDSVDVFHFGFIQPTDKARQSIVDVTLEMYI